LNGSVRATTTCVRVTSRLVDVHAVVPLLKFLAPPRRPRQRKHCSRFCASTPCRPLPRTASRINVSCALSSRRRRRPRPELLRLQGQTDPTDDASASSTPPSPTSKRIVVPAVGNEQCVAMLAGGSVPVELQSRNDDLARSDGCNGCGQRHTHTHTQRASAWPAAASGTCIGVNATIRPLERPTPRRSRSAVACSLTCKDCARHQHGAAAELQQSNGEAASKRRESHKVSPASSTPADRGLDPDAGAQYTSLPQSGSAGAVLTPYSIWQDLYTCRLLN
jgi:hypothetical protein